MTYELTGIKFTPALPDKFERMVMTPIIDGDSSEVQNTNWIIYPYDNHGKGGSWGNTHGSNISMTFSLEIKDSVDE